MDYSICENIITSNDYLDAILKFRSNSPNASDIYDIPCHEVVDNNWIILHNPIEVSPELSLTTYGYSTIPKLYGLMDTTSLDDSGITRLHNQPVLNLSGNGVIIGFIDTGIDYTHRVFVDSGNTSKILAIWDQTLEGTPPEGFLYGSEFTQDMINEALASDNPLNIVPTTDTIGHGTFLAGVAAGYAYPPEDFIGAAYNANIVMVKLKPAKQYLRDYYLIKEDAVAYQENDIMMAIKYLRETSLKFQMPMVICLGVGSNQSGHIGETPLGDLLDSLAKEDGFAIVAATGNEGNERHHFLGKYDADPVNNVVEVKVGDNEKGFVMEMWVTYPDIYSLEIISPLGNAVPSNVIFEGATRDYTFTLEKTKISIDYRSVETVSGQQVITLKFTDPTPGIWQIKVMGDVVVNGIYNMWLPISDFLSDDTYFIKSDPTITLTTPSTVTRLISVGGYNHNDGSFYLASGRGYTANNVIKPDIVAPAVSVFGPLANTNNQFGYKSGTSIAAAHVAGGAALLFEWGLINGNVSFMNSRDIKSYMIKGAERSPMRTYPNPEYGYGKLDMYNIFATL